MSSSDGRRRRRSWLRAAAALARRPPLWPAALVQAVRLARPRWWARSPYLPLPDREYLRYRMLTQYGAPGPPAGEDLVTYLEWCREMAANQRRSRQTRR